MKKAPSPLVSLIPLVVLVIMLFATIRTFGSDALSGGSQVSLLTTTAVCILIGMGFYKMAGKTLNWLSQTTLQAYLPP